MIIFINVTKCARIYYKIGFTKHIGERNEAGSALIRGDAAIGGKTGVNLVSGKNLIGTFHQPVGVWIDTAVLATLPEREYRSGLAEVVKYGVILDPELFGYLEANAEPVLRREPGVVQHRVRVALGRRMTPLDEVDQSPTGPRSQRQHRRALVPFD